jgi:DNA-binding transcriptional LysR family regulator
MAKALPFPMDLRRLATFRAVAHHGNLQTAAMTLGVTAPALSIQLKKLEAEMGVQLFQHLPNRLVLTERGATFFRELDAIFESLDRATATAIGQVDKFHGKATIALSSDLAKVFAPRIASFIKEHPQVSVTILARASRVGMTTVMKGEADAAIGFYRKVPRNMAKTVIAVTNLSLFYPEGHPLQRRAAPSLRDIAAHRVIMLRRISTTGRLIAGAFTSAGGVEKVLEAGSCRAAMDFVRLGLGVAVVHGICAAAEPDERSRVVDVSNHFGTTDVALVTRKTAVFSAAQKALIRRLTERLAV